MNEPITGDIYGEERARQRTREFLLQEAARPLPDLLAKVEAALSEFEATLQAVSEDQAAFLPGGAGEDAFSVAQVARHVAGSGDIMATRLRSIGLGEQPTRATSPGNFGDVQEESLAGLAEPLRQARRAIRASVEAIDGREHLETVAAHPMFGELNCRAYLRLIGLHFQDHARQVETIKASANYPNRPSSA